MRSEVDTPVTRQLSSARLAQRREHLVDTIRGDFPRPPARRFGRRVALISIASILVAGTAAATYLASRPTTDPFTVGCYDALDQQASTMVVAFKGNDGLGAAALCAKHWTQQGEAVPTNLVTCVVSGGGLGVFPNPSAVDPDHACESIGAATVERGSPYGGLSTEEVRALDTTIATRYEATWGPGRACGPVDVLHRVVSEALHEKGASTWTIHDLTSESDDDCTAFTIDAREAKVILLGRQD